MMLTDFIYYDLKVAALLAVFYLFYQLLLARETLYRLNRMVLLTAIALSLILPLCVVTLHETLVGDSISQVRTGAAMFSDASESATEPTGQNNFGEWLLLAVLVIGMAIRLFYILHGYRKLQRLIASGEQHTLFSGIEVRVVEAPVAPFSWMHTVVLSRSEWQSPSPAVLAHEEAHVRHRHSYDVCVVEILTALQWFNPVVWFLRQELRTLHEYEADASVLSSGFDESQYIYLLMQKATGIQACVLANGISTHRTKKRILMMLKPKSNRIAWLKTLYVLPIVFVSLALSAKTVVDYTVSEDDSQKPKTNKTVYVVDGMRVTEENVHNIKKEDIVNVDVISNREWLNANAPEAESAVIIRTNQSDEPVFDKCEQMPVFPGGDVKLMEFIAQNIKYPQQAIECGLQGRVIVQFIVGKDGSLSDVKALENPKESPMNTVVVNANMPDKQRQDAEAHNRAVQALRDEAVRVVNAMPRWTPGKQNGKAVRVKYVIPVTYRLN